LKLFSQPLLPPPTDPNVAGAPLHPLPGYPLGVRVWQRSPTAFGPNPLSLPGPIARNPGVCIRRSRWRDRALFQWRRRNLRHHSRTGLLTRPRRVRHIARLLSAAGEQCQRGNHRNQPSQV
jgi:hypothetical protein